MTTAPADIPVIHCQSTRDLPRWLYPVVEGAGLTLEKVLDEIQRKYPGHSPRVYQLGGLLYVEHPEARP